ncbi:MAG: tripartite tricarboxylate transporter permease [Candidatus Thermoplasmatota archaeon]
MDPSLLILALAGSIAGVAAMALPGVHVNALALVVLALAPDSGERGVAFLLGALAGSPFGLALGTTFLGASTDDGAMPSLPAHALAAEGRGAQAVALQAWGAFAGIALALPMAAAMRPLIESLPWGTLLPWLLLAVLVLLVASERTRPPVHRRWTAVPWQAHVRARGPLQTGPRVGRYRFADPHKILEAARVGDEVEVELEATWARGPLSRASGMALAALTLALSGWLGWIALRMGAASPLGLPASSLLPLLAGLFAVPSLLTMLRADHAPVHVRLRVHPPPRGELLRRVAPGALAASLLGLVPGITTSHVAALTPRAEHPERALLTLGAVNGAAVVFGLLAWHALGKARHGALVAAQRIAAPIAWHTTLPPPELLSEAALVLLSAGAACLLARALARPAAAAPPRPLARMGLALVVLMTLATCGLWGLSVLVAGALVGSVPVRLGVRRSLLMGAILVPAALRAWGIG